jgi:hypothetical protein
VVSLEDLLGLALVQKLAGHGLSVGWPWPGQGGRVGWLGAWASSARRRGRGQGRLAKPLELVPTMAMKRPAASWR